MVDPPQIGPGPIPGESFSVDIYITDAEAVHAWEVKLGYAPYMGMVVVTDIEEGPFLMEGGDTVFAKYVDHFYGFAMFGATGDANHYGIDGEGILATVYFAILEVGQCDLTLFDTILLNRDKEELPHCTEDGFYLGLTADLIPPDLPTERPIGGGSAQKDWKDACLKRWGTATEFSAEVINLGWEPVWARNVFTSVNEHTGEIVTLYSGQEYFPTITYRTEVLYVNEEIPVFDMWTKYGTSPYLDAAGDGSYIEAYDDGMLSNAYGFEDVSLGPYDKIIDVVLEGYTQYALGPDDSMDMDTYCFTPADYMFAWLGSLYGEAAWTWKTPRWIGDHVHEAVPAVTTEAGLNDFSCLFYYWTADGLPHGDMRIDQARLVVTIETGGVYQIDDMWTHVDAGMTVELPPAIWNLEKQNTGKWYTTYSTEYRYLDPYTIPSILFAIGDTTFTHEWWVKGEGL